MSLFHVFLVHDTIEVEPVYFPAINHSTSASNDNYGDNNALESIENEQYVMTFEDILIHRLTEKYVGKVVPSCGLCVAVQRIESFSPSMIKGITAAAWLSVTFALCIFSPSTESRIRAIILSQSAHGIYLTLAEFCTSYPIFIPAEELVPNSFYDEQQQSWFCLIDQVKDSNVHSTDNKNNNNNNTSDRMHEVQRNEYVIGDEVIVRVLSCHVHSLEEMEDGSKGLMPSIDVSSSSSSPSSVINGDLQNKNDLLLMSSSSSSGTSSSLMEITVSCVGDGLGPVA